MRSFTKTNHVSAHALRLGGIDHISSACGTVQITYRHGAYLVHGFVGPAHKPSKHNTHVSEAFRTVREARRFARFVVTGGPVGAFPV